MIELADEGDDFPDVVVAMRLAEGGHAGHADAVLDDAEQLAVGAIFGFLVQIGRRGLQSGGELLGLNAWAAVALDAHFAVVMQAVGDGGRVVRVRIFFVRCARRHCG